jgi:hypothetical protein
MPVFISYRHMDRPHAMNINSRLMQANIRTYLDVLDPESQTTDDITGVITRNITECTHLLAVVSEKPRCPGGCRSKLARRPLATGASARSRPDRRIAAVPR